MASKLAIRKSLGATDVLRLRKIFTDLQWPESRTFEDPVSNRFDRFCEFAAHLSQTEIEVFIDLTREFLWVKEFAYRERIYEALKAIPNSLVANRKSLYLVPVVAPKDRGIAKSSSAMLYSTAKIGLRHFPKLRAILKDTLTDPQYLKDSMSQRDNSLVLFIDDFVGTGQTVEEMLLEYDRNWRIPSDLPVIVSIVAQAIGKKRIEDLGYKFFSAIVRSRAISDSTTVSDKKRVLKVIRNIEERMKISRKYSLGFEKSEALVSMIRTPNNTLPIFWWDSRPNGEKAD